GEVRREVEPVGGLRRRRQVRHVLREAACLGAGATVLHPGVRRAPRDLLGTRVGGHNLLKDAGQDHRQLPGAATRIPRKACRGCESRQEVAQRGGVGWATRRVSARHVGKMIFEAPRRRHRSSVQVSETRSLPKLWFFSLRTTRKPAAWYR